MTDTDFDILQDETVTIRERDTLVQVRTKISEIAPMIREYAASELPVLTGISIETKSVSPYREIHKSRNSIVFHNIICSL